ncbi:hypothetical protein GCM10009654_28720 [Streptomyces hebeiensis]|uniref:Uncharacterized protein n=1 Tax=Streptomyces hebeiensis TaxID=229486 RepID=A0ABN1UW81_9ACTN
MIVAAARRYAAREAVGAEGAPDYGCLAARARALDPGPGPAPGSWFLARAPVPILAPVLVLGRGPARRAGPPDEVSGRDAVTVARIAQRLVRRVAQLLWRPPRHAEVAHNGERPPRGCRDGLSPDCPTPVPVALTGGVDCGARQALFRRPAGRTQVRVFSVI